MKENAVATCINQTRSKRHQRLTSNSTCLRACVCFMVPILKNYIRPEKQVTEHLLRVDELTCWNLGDLTLQPLKTLQLLICMALNM